MGASRGSDRQRDKPKKHKDRGIEFNEKHIHKYGLAVCSRNGKTNVVETVMCKFCVAFGKESAADATRKRRATANIKYFRQPFRADHYLSHLEINHKHKWIEYEQSSSFEKEIFFGTRGEDATINSLSLTQHLLHAHTSNTSHNVDSTMIPGFQRVGPMRLSASEIEKSVVDELVFDMFFNVNDNSGWSKKLALDVFRLKDNAESYEIVIKNQRLYDLATKFIACGASFRLASRMVQCTKDETGMACYGGCSEHTVAGYVRTIIASNLQKIALMMRSTWAFTIATDAADHQGTSYLDIRVRLWQKGALQDFHLCTFPAFAQHYPTASYIEHLEKLFNVMDLQWRSKLLGATTSGSMKAGCNTGMTGSQQGLIARLTTLVNKPAFYLVWSGVHQLEMVAKRSVYSFCQKAFYDELVSVLATLRQDQQRTHQEGSLSSFLGEVIPEVTAAFSGTRGFVEKITEALKWLIEHRIAIVQLLQTTSSASVPSASWWVCVVVTHRVMAEIACFMQKLRSLENGAKYVDEQVQELCKLTLLMMDVVGARRDLWEPLNPDEACAAGTFQLAFQNAQQFIQNKGGSLATEIFETLRGVERVHITKSVAHFAVTLIAEVAMIAQEGRHYCTKNTGVLVSPPMVLPVNVYKMGEEAFMKTLCEQEPRLRETYSDEEIKTVQSEYKEFVLAVERELILGSVLKKHDRETDVSFAWSCINGRFCMLQEFIGGLASVVPDMSASTLSADLAWLNWEKPDYRQTMVDFALEGILHAKQKMKVELVDVHGLQSATSSLQNAADESLSSSTPSTPDVHVSICSPAPSAATTAPSSVNACLVGIPLLSAAVAMPPSATLAQDMSFSGISDTTETVKKIHHV